MASRGHKAATLAHSHQYEQPPARMNTHTHTPKKERDSSSSNHLASSIASACQCSLIRTSFNNHVLAPPQLVKNFPPRGVAPATVTSMTAGKSWQVKREVDGTIPSTARSRESKGVTLGIHAIQVPHNCKSGEHARASPAPACEELLAPACGSCHRDIYDSGQVVATRQRPRQHSLTHTSMNNHLLA